MIKYPTIYLMLVWIILLTVSCKNKNASETKATTVKTEPVVTTSFKVWGNCDMCKETIEGSVKVNGVLNASWDSESKEMQVTYDTTQLSLDQIQKNIAAAGYDNELYKAEEKAYGNLPECCQYDRK